MKRKIHCPRCQCENIRSSKKHLLKDKVRSLVLVRPFRCRKCDHRFYASVLFHFAKVGIDRKSSTSSGT